MALLSHAAATVLLTSCLPEPTRPSSSLLSAGWQVLLTRSTRRPTTISFSQASTKATTKVVCGGQGFASSPAELIRYLKSDALQSAQQHYWEHLRSTYEVRTRSMASWLALQPGIWPTLATLVQYWITLSSASCSCQPTLQALSWAVPWLVGVRQLHTRIEGSEERGYKGNQTDLMQRQVTRHTVLAWLSCCPGHDWCHKHWAKRHGLLCEPQTLRCWRRCYDAVPRDLLGRQPAPHTFSI